jgi:hypothetical protein
MPSVVSDQEARSLKFKIATNITIALRIVVDMNLKGTGKPFMETSLSLSEISMHGLSNLHAIVLDMTIVGHGNNS